MTNADALLAGRLTKRGLSWLLLVLIAVAPVEAVSVDNALVLTTLPVRIASFAAILLALRTDRLDPIGAGRLILAQGVATTVGWALLLDSPPAQLAFETTGYAAILSVYALLMAPRIHRRRWSLAVTGLILIASGVRLLPDDVLLLTQSMTILLVYGIGIATLDQHTNRVEAQSTMASFDPLTGLYNRRPTLTRLSAQLGGTSPGSGAASVLMLDLDRFKQLNDTLGHEAGDEALCQVAAVLRSISGTEDVACRWGGEEFLVLLADTDEPGAMATAERCRTDIAQCGVTASVGVAELRSGDTVTSWVARADQAMYVAKERGRNGVIAAPPIEADEDAA